MWRDRYGTVEASRPGLWIWLFPATLAVHFMEELSLHGGFYSWLSTVTDERLPGAMLLPAAIVGVALASGAVYLAIRDPRFLWVVPALGGIYLVNAIFHVMASWLTGTLSPGTVSGLVLWLPLGTAGVAWSFRSLPTRRALLGTGVGLGAGLAILALVVPFGRV